MIPEPLTVLYRDTHLIAIDKPSGLLVHRSGIDRHETRFAMQILRDQIGQRVHPLHRLDKPTSGVLLFALDADTARLTGPLFECHRVRKHYLAVVRGWTDAEGHIDYPLREILDAITDAKARDDKPAQTAITDYRTLGQTELPFPVGRYPSARYSLLELEPRTGRKHQLRRHMKHIFHPIVGDTTHGDGRHNRLFRDRFGSDRLLLHCRAMTLPHPVTGDALSIEAPLSADFAATLAHLSLPWP
ncbi:MAG: tRNA pseudouridine(65) synthase TruC [Gammaproteobacteria bacterium]|nr:tRNA pseudouridine(65) synthase TruC [Gammaproteobacteria bacterium]MCP5137979.1 tRNA pseudouridine(65) synthase TruC [Gammaproteobacteria bacterium]